MTKFFFLFLTFSLSTFASEGGIWVNGQGSVEVKPDIANFSFTISTLDQSAKVAQQKNAKVAETLVSKIKSLGVAGKDIQTGSFQLNAEYDYQSRQRVFKGHRVSHTFHVTMRKIDMLGTALDQITENGNDDVSIGGIGFGLSEPARLKLKSLELAVANAREKATTLAASSQKKLGKVVAIEELSQNYQAPVMRMEMMKTASAMADSTQIQSGEVGVSAEVKVRFEMD